MGLASMRSRVKRIERALRVPVNATDAAARAKMVSLLTLMANDDWAWSEWLALSGGGGAAVEPSLLGGLAARINAASAAETGSGGPDR